MAPSSKLTIVPHKKVQPLSVIDPSHENSAIIVRVLRKWRVYPSHGGNNPVSVELVLVDKEGTKIQGHIDKMYIYKHDASILEGSVYNISKFTVALNSGKYRAARHEYRLNFKLCAMIRPLANVEVPIATYNFTPPNECFQPDFNQDYLVDVAGVLTGIGQEQEFYKNTGMTSRVKIDLENGGYRFSVTLFGEYVTELKQWISAGRTENAVVAILFCKVGTWPGGISIQSTMHATKLLINPNIPEARALRETISHTITSPALTVSQHSKNQASEDDFLNVDQKYTLADVKESVEVNEFVAFATINSVVEEIDWWYWACRCSKKCKEDPDEPDMYYCPKCDTHVTKVTRKYLLKLRIIDDTDSLNVVLFDHTARVLIGKSSEDVYNSWKEDTDRDYLPIELMQLKGKEALFRIQGEGTNGGRYPRSFRARNVSDDSDLIRVFNAKWGDVEAAIEDTPEVLLIEDTPTAGSLWVENSTTGVSEDLIGKFDQSASDSCTGGTATTTAEHTIDMHETPLSKRKDSVHTGSSSISRPLKSVKIEK